MTWLDWTVAAVILAALGLGAWEKLPEPGRLALRQIAAEPHQVSPHRNR